MKKPKGLTLLQLENALKHAREHGAIDKSPVLFEHAVSLDSYDNESFDALIENPIDDGSLLQSEVVDVRAEIRCADEPAIFIDIGYLVVG